MSKLLANLCGFLLAVMALQGAHSADSNIEATVEKYMWYPIKLDVTAMTDAERGQFIAEFRKHVNSTSFRYRHRARTALLSLGDEETARELVRQVQNTNVPGSAWIMGAFDHVYNPALIPVLAELLYYPEPVKEYPSGDLIFSTRPLAAAERIAYTIRYAPEFNAELNAWLEAVAIPRNLTGEDRVRRLYGSIRRLWEANKDAFLRKDYAAVKPPSRSWPPWVVGTVVLALVAVGAGIFFKLRGKGRTTQ